MKRERIAQLILLLVMLLVFDCRKKEELPEKPTNLTATIVSETEIDLSWSDNSTNEAGFKLERSKNGGVDWTTVTSTAKDISSFKNTGLEAGTSYSFKVMAFNAVGNSEYSNIASGNTPAAIVYSLAIITTSSVSDITQNAASGGGNVTADGNSPVLARGVCWGTETNPTVQNSKTTDGGGTGAFTSSLSGLLPNKQYYMRAYATNSVGTAYGEQVTFTTLAPAPVVATLTTDEASSVTSFSATSGGNITSDGGAAVTLRGICWSTTENPTVENDTTKNGSGTGTFTSKIAGLSGSTTYYVRAYAVNSAGTAYGAQITFTTSAPSAYVPSITTVAGSGITATTVQTGGNITSDKGLPVTVRGVCWSTSPAPSISNDTTKNGSGSGSFVSTIKNLIPNTKYYIRAYATNSQGTGYGDEVTITTENVAPPTAASAEATSISGTSATLNGSVNANGTETTISFEYGTTFMYGTTAAATPASTAGVTPSTVLSIITGLTPNTLYHFRIKAVSPGGTVYGDNMTFTTLTLPSATTLDVQNIYPATATITGYINPNGNTTSIKFEYGTTDSYGHIMLGIPDNATGTANSASKADLTGLTKSTLYHYRIVAENRAGISYGEDKTFTTPENDPVIPSLTTAAVTDITQTTATGGGNISSDGGGSVTARGICYSTTSNPTLEDGKTINGTGTGDFTSPFTGLAPGILYHVRAYATNFIGTAYGNEVTFTTSPPDAVLPTLSTLAVTSVTHNSASGGGDITDDGGGSVTARGICWSTAEEPTTADFKTEDGTGTGAFTGNMTGLSSNTIYYVRAYAMNSAGTAYGNQESFTTAETPAVVSTLTTTAASDITTNSFTSGGNITSDGGGAVTARGVCYSTTANPTVAGTKTTDGSGTGSFASSVSGLSASTKYYVRAYATNSAGTAYGTEIEVTTAAPAPVLPTVSTTDPVADIAYNAATAGGNVTDQGNATVTERGVCWSTVSNPTTADNKLTNGTGAGSYTVSLTGLTPSTTYHVRAYAINSVGTAYGNDVSFITSAPPYTLPSLTTTSASSPTSSGATTGGEITSDGGATVTARGVCYGTSSNPSLSGNYTTNGTGIGIFTDVLTGLSASTTYYVRAYATNAAGTKYGNEVSFTTLSPPVELPTVTTSAITPSTTTASAGGNVTYGGTSSVTARGVCWSTTMNPTTANSKTTNGTGTGSFTSSISGLNSCTTYHVRAYATNSTGTTYGSDEIFTTGSVLPTITTTTLSSQTSTSVSTGGTVSGDCGSGVTERGVCYGTSSGPTTAGSKITYASGGSGSYTISITGLTPCTGYYIRAYAINASGTQYGNELSFTTPAATATVTTTTVTSVTSTTASTGGTVSGNCTSGATRGICYSTSANPTISNSVITAGTTGSGSYTISITGLSSCTTYYVRAWVTNSAGTSYGSQQTFTTGTVVASVSTTSVTGVTNSTAVSGGSVTGSCGSAVTARGVCWNTTGSPTLANSYTSNSSGSGSYTSNLTGLTELTTYYVRAYATNSAGTVYGTQVSFTTLADPPSVTSSYIYIYDNSQAVAGGNVTSDGGATVTERGICWSTSSYPTILNSKATSGTGTGSFTVNATGLTAGTLYYVRAYATNSTGTSYGVNRSFTTPSTVTDYDGNAYGTVSYNGSVWTQSNLKTEHYNDGTALIQASDTSMYGYYSYYHAYNDNTTYGNRYGYMYNGSVIGGTKNICPTGWHVPTQSEWSSMTSYLGGYTVAGSVMNQLSALEIIGGRIFRIYYWNTSITGHDNSGLFYGRGGGYYNGSYTGLSDYTRWWTSTSDRYVYLYYGSGTLYGVGSNLTGIDADAYYVRCKKD